MFMVGLSDSFFKRLFFYALRAANKFALWIKWAFGHMGKDALVILCRASLASLPGKSGRRLPIFDQSPFFIPLPQSPVG